MLERSIDLRAGRNRDVRPDLANARALDEDDLVGEHAAGLGIEQPAGANGGDWAGAGCGVEPARRYTRSTKDTRRTDPEY